MPKIPTFKAQGSITQLVGTTNAPQMGLDQTLATALSPLTDMVVKKAVQENDTQNRTEALRLGNEFTRKMNTIEDTIANDNTGLGVNKQSANAYYKQQTNNLINQFKSQASNNATATLFTNNALSAVNRGIFRIDTIVDKNVFKDLTTQVELAEKSLITQALFNNRDENIVDEFGMLGNVNDFDYASLQTNLTKLYTDAFSGKIPAANLNSMVNNIPALVQGFQANKDIYDNPSFAYAELEKGENSSVYPDLKVEQRIKLINKVETMMAQPMQTEFANVIFSLQGNGTEQPFDFDFAKKILPPAEYNQLKTTYDLAKINAEDVRLIRTLSLDEADKLIESKNYNTDSYVGAADLITQNKLKQGLEAVRDNTQKQFLLDPVQLQIDTNPEIAELTNDYRTETDPELKLSNRKILTNAIIEGQIKRGADLTKLKILTKQEITQFKDQFLDTSITSEDKLKLIEQLKVTFGDENMGKIVNHLQDEKTPKNILMAISTDSVELAKELFDSSSLTSLKKLAIKNDIQPNDVSKKISKKLESFAEVINAQGEGSESKADFLLEINDALLKATLLRVDKNTSVDDAVESATNDFLDDYVINNSLTALIPKTINRKPIPVAAVENKNEAILIGLKDTSPGNFLDRFMGPKGYMHYASSLNANIQVPPSMGFEQTTISEEEIKKRIGFTIRNYSKWLNNSDMTGMVLYADFGDAGMQPIKNADGQRIEYYLLKLPNQDPTIYDTASVYPVTGDELPLVPDPPSDDYFQYNENLIDEIIVDGKKNSEIPVGNQSSTFQFDENSQPQFVNLDNSIDDNIDKKVLGLFEYGQDKGLKGLVPNNNGIVIGQSGVTIAMGYDLGSKNLNELKTMFPNNPDIVNKLKPYLGLKGKAALDAINTTPFTITENERETINKFATKKTLKDIKSAWSKTTKNNKNAPTKSFSELPKEVATVIFSVAWQHGIDATKKFNFWKQVTTGDWDGAIKNLRDWDGTGKPSQTQSRRDQEADILEKWLNTISKKA